MLQSSWYKQTYRYNGYNRAAWMQQQAANVPAGCQVLDVGAGTGRYRPLFNHCEYKAQDFGQEPGTIGIYTPLDYESDITNIPVDDQSFDVVICTEVLEHVPEPILALKEIARILRPGGKLLLTAPLMSFLHQEPYHFYGGYTPHWYEKFLTEFGLTIESIEPNQGFFSFFGQESVRYSQYLDPRHTQGSFLTRAVLTTLWVITLPMLRGFFPLLGKSLDKLSLEKTATIGYHVVAVKNQT
ncbi:MAG: class I SAM-dependent methyltransferase [Chloroflexota bacterium]